MTNEELKTALVQGDSVEWQGTQYRVTAIVYRCRSGKIDISAELYDKNGHSVIYAKSCEIKKKGD